MLEGKVCHLAAWDFTVMIITKIWFLTKNADDWFFLSFN